MLSAVLQYDAMLLHQCRHMGCWCDDQGLFIRLWFCSWNSR
eukprot:CCRYP_000417-RA/>CCRYP_000417-RA protein AED:0.00 eAED:0.00 QI:109/1/1/1/0/0/2/22/40